jgi:hypothetical protein
MVLSFNKFFLLIVRGPESGFSLPYGKDIGNILEMLDLLIGQKPNTTVGYLQEILDSGMSQKTNMSPENAHDISDSEEPKTNETIPNLQGISEDSGMGQKPSTSIVNLQDITHSGIYSKSKRNNTKLIGITDLSKYSNFSIDNRKVLVRPNSGLIRNTDPAQRTLNSGVVDLRSYIYQGKLTKGTNEATNGMLIEPSFGRNTTED